MTAARDKVVDRIRKLLALSQSSNEHEAASAAARAAQLMAEHQVCEASLEELDEPILSSVLDAGGRLPSWKRTLAIGCARGLGCEAYLRRERTGEREQGQVVVVGTPAAQSAVAYMYGYLVREVERLADQAFEARARQGTRRGARHWKGAFRLGAAAEIRRRLIEQRKQTIDRARDSRESAQALVHLDDMAARIAAALAKLPLRHVRTRRAVSADGYGAGAIAGQSVALEGGTGLAPGAPRLPA
jgi:hypothetical protein